MAVDRVLLIPGLLEPGVMMWPLRFYLRRRFSRVDLWHDRIVFRELEKSVERLAEVIDGKEGDRIGIVTHSFGDWVARQAMARCGEHRVEALVSVAPVMRSGLLTSLAYHLTGNLIPEIRVISDAAAAAANGTCELRTRRLVLWATIDAFVSRVDLPPASNATVRTCLATHITSIMQPNILSQTADWLAADTREAEHAGFHGG